MRKKFITYLLLTLVSLGANLKAQDVHFSHIHASPIFLNPSMTGLIHGDFRVIANYKNQWRSTDTNFNTAQISLDGRLSQIKRNASFNMGLMFLTDVAGDLKYRQTSFQIPMSVILALNREGTHNIAFGLQNGFFHYSADLSKIEAFDQEPLIGTLFTTNKFVYDFSFGYSWYSVFDGKSSFYIGNSFYHINRPQIVTSTNDEEGRLFMKTNFVAGGEIIFKAGKQALMPSILSMFQGPNRETTLGSFYRYRLSKKNDKDYQALLFGLWTRMYFSPRYNSGFDALITTFRYDRKKVSYALSYDFTLSKYAVANQLRGGLELSIVYTGHAKEGKRPNRTISCPAW